MSYTANIFDFLGDEGDDGQQRRKQAPKPAAPKPAATTAKPAAANTPKAPAAQPAAPQQKAAAPAKPAPAANKQGGAAQPKPQGDAPRPAKTDYVKRPPRQPQQGGAGPAGGFDSDKPRVSRKDTREGAPRRGRQFDRRSGTGRPANENKKAGAGKGNWGKQEEDVEGVEGVPAAEAVEGAADKEATNPNEETVKEGEAAAPKEEEKETLGYAEYLESIKNKTIKGVEAPKIRQAGEGVDQAVWKDYAPISKDGQSDEPGLKKKDKKPAAETKKEKETGEQKISVDQVFRVRRPDAERRERRDRDDRRGDRGDRRDDRGDRRDDRGDRRDDRRGPARGPKSPKVPRAGGNQNNNAAKDSGFRADDFPALSGSGGVANPTPAAAPAATPAPAAAAANTQQPQAPVKA